MLRTKTLNMDDLKRGDFALIDRAFDRHFGPNWPQVPLRRWEYVAAVVFSGIADKPGHCLEAGCGTSVFAPFLAKIGCRVHAIDIGIRDDNKNGVKYHNASMLNIPMGDESFDYVFAISSIEHVNAGRFAIRGMAFDTGDTYAMLELYRVLKPGGILILTTDYAGKYYPPPGLWPSGSHRIYNYFNLRNRIINPASAYDIFLYDKADWWLNDNLKEIEPKGYDYTEIIVTMKKTGAK